MKVSPLKKMFSEDPSRMGLQSWLKTNLDIHVSLPLLPVSFQVPFTHNSAQLLKRNQSVAADRINRSLRWILGRNMRSLLSFSILCAGTTIVVTFLLLPGWRDP